MKIHVDFSDVVRFGDSDGTEPRHSLNILGAVKTEWRVYDLRGDYAIHTRYDLYAGGKAFRWKHPDGTNSRDGEISSTDRAYGLELVDGQHKGLLVEGEKAADAARAALPSWWLVVATVCGALTIPDVDVLARLARVPSWWLFADHDANGRGQEHMASIGAYLKRRCRVRMVRWRDAPPGGDVADFLIDHSTAELLELLLHEAVPVK
ncbi:MAG: hypothetical protein WCC30_06515 [Candidatus Dormiibacterota bacterium]